MKIAIYNQNNHDSIITAAFLQTLGWVTYSSRETIPEDGETYYWLGVVPTKKHFIQDLKKGVQHVCFVKNADYKRYSHLLVPNVTFGAGIDDTDIEEKPKLAFVGRNTIFKEVTFFLGISTPEQKSLQHLIMSFHDRHASQNVVAMTTYNVLKALECLRTRDTFTPEGNIDGIVKVDDTLTIAIEKTSEILTRAKRVLNHAAIYKTIGTSHGPRRVVRTFESEYWWFIRRLLLPTDIAFNINVSSTGTLIDATQRFEFDFGVADPIMVVA